MIRHSDLNHHEPIPMRHYALYDLSTPGGQHEPLDIILLPVDMLLAQKAVIESNRERWARTRNMAPVPGYDFRLEPLNTTTYTQHTQGALA